MKKTMLFFIIMVCSLSIGFSQKIKDDTQKHIVKTYPYLNLPESVKTYNVRVTFLDEITLSVYNLDGAKLRNQYLQLNTLTYDSLSSRLIMDILVEPHPPKFATGTTKSLNNQVEYQASLYSRLTGSVTLSLDGKVFAYRSFDFPINSSFNSTAGLTRVDEYWVSDSCATLDGRKGYTPTELNSFIDNSGVPKQAWVMQVDATQITKLYKIASLFMKEQVDVRYKENKTRYYTVKYKEKDVTRIDSCYNASLVSLENLTIQNYIQTQNDFSNNLLVWERESSKYGNSSENELPILWAMLINTATAADFSENYEVSLRALFDASKLNYEVKETNKLSRAIIERAERYNRRYNLTKVYQESKLVYLNRKTPPENKIILQEEKKLKAEQNAKALEARIAAQKKYEEEYRLRRLADTLNVDLYKYVHLEEQEAIRQLDVDFAGRKISTIKNANYFFDRYYFAFIEHLLIKYKVKPVGFLEDLNSVYGYCRVGRKWKKDRSPSCKEAFTYSSNDTSAMKIKMALMIIERGEKPSDIAFKNCASKNELELLALFVKINNGKLPDYKVSLNMLSRASDFGYVDIARFLLDHGVMPDPKDSDFFDCLYRSVEYPEVFFLLIDKVEGYKTDMRSLEFAMVEASRNGCVEVLKYLLDKGIDPDKMHGHYTFYEWAEKDNDKNKKEVLALLSSYRKK